MLNLTKSALVSFSKGKIFCMYTIHRKVAPYNLIQKDFQQMDSSERLRTTWDVERLIFLQSVQGHAHEGHAVFHGNKFPDTSVDDIAKALRLDPVWVRTERQRLIDEVTNYVDAAIRGDKHIHLSNGDGTGFIGSSMFRDLNVKPADILRGLYLGGLRDNPRVRFEMEQNYGVVIGGGECYLVNTKVMREYGLSQEILAHGSHEDMLDYYREIGLIVSDSGQDDGDIQYVYIRHRRGPGASDDAAIVAAGLLFGFGTAVGVFLADAIDTLEKHVPIFSDQDQQLSQKIKDSYKALDVDESDVRHLAYLCATPLEAEIRVPDSSLRLLLMIDRRHDLTAVESHLRYVQGKESAPIHVGHESTLNTEFYAYLQKRVDDSPGPK